MLGDYDAKARTDLSDADVAEAKTRREKYFSDSKREWHPYFEKMESVLNRVNPAWTYGMGSAAHIDLVACATRDRWGNLTSGCQAAMVANCREYVLAALSRLPNGTVLLCDGPRATREVQNLGFRVELRPNQLINVRPASGGDVGSLGDVFVGGNKLPVRGWSSQVSRLTAVWRNDLALWLHGTLFPGSLWVGYQALKAGDGRSIRIVMVNDEPFVLESFELVIRRWFKNVTILSFENGAVALKELLQSAPDLLITDDRMPVMAGQELCQELFDRKITYPIIVDSAWEPTEQWVRAFASQGFGISFLPVPCDIEAILKAVETALKIKRLAEGA